MPMPITRSAIQRIADHRIRAAIAAGEMDGMPGAGKPIPGIDDAYDPRTPAPLVELVPPSRPTWLPFEASPEALTFYALNR